MKTKTELNDFNFIENEISLNSIVEFKIKEFYKQDSSYFNKINTIFLKAAYITCILKNEKTNKDLNNFLTKKRLEMINEFSGILSLINEYVLIINKTTKNKETDIYVKRLLIKEKRKIISYKDIVLEAKKLLELEKQGVINYKSLEEMKKNILKRS